ncbi:MAG TPA: hypothetical protein EYM34_12395, partial [Alphaproteobacteria bacterium]|nr:hypothetical protein [Alphaproteobacteria bacterium]
MPQTAHWLSATVTYTYNNCRKHAWEKAVSNENLHTDALIIDGLVISKWSRDVFLDMRKGGLTAANCTCSVWEGIRVSLDNIAAWKRMFEAHGDLILQVRTSEDIPRATQEGKTG